ncbi:MAG: hypothetical protein H6998_04380 [Hahellaceae bacterium]|nr:hypothetical protein [Hahellaceae bacterium]
MSEFGESGKGVLTMIYRLSSKFEELYYSADRPATPDGIMQGGAEEGEFEYQFEEQPLDLTWQHCRVFKAPILPEWRMSRDLTIEKNVKYPIEMPDFIAWQGGIYVSDIVKEIIEEVDEIGHQFWPVSAFKCGKNGVNKEALDKIYYRMNMRRFVNIAFADTSASSLDFSPTETMMEDRYLSTVRSDQDLRAIIESLPIWQHYGQTRSKGRWKIYDHVIYFSELLMSELREAGINGVMEYSKYEGTKQEMVGHV